MKFPTILLVFVWYGYSLSGQQVRSIDTTKTKAEQAVGLSEVIVVGHSGQADTLVLFHQASPLTSVDEVWQRLNDVQAIRRGAYAWEPTIHGLSGGQVQVTVDGMHLYSACTDRMDPVTSYVETANLKQVEVQAGADGLDHGASVGGSLNLQTHEPGFSPTPTWNGLIAINGYSASEGMDGTFQIARESRKWSSVLSSTYRSHQPYRAGNGETIDFSGYNKFNLGWSSKYMVSSKHLFKADVIIDRAWNVGYPALPMDVAFANAAIGGLTYTHYPKKGALQKLKMKAFANSIAHAMDDTERDVVMHMDMPGWSRTMGGFAEAHLHFSHSQHLLIKANLHHHFSRAEMTMYPEGEAPMFMLTWPDTRRWIGGLFARYHVTKLRNEWTVETRMDQVNARVTDELGQNQLRIFGYKADLPYIFWLPAISAGWKHTLSEKWETTLRGGFTSRAPTVSELFGFYLFNASDGYDYIGNPNLPSEKSGQLQASIHYQSPKLTAQVKAFGYYFWDYIFGQANPDLSAMTIGANGVKSYVALPHAMLLGAGTTIQWSVTPHLALQSEATLLRGQDHEARPLPLLAPLHGRNTIRYHRNAWLLQMEHEWATAQNRVSTAFGETPSPGYHVIHINGKYRFQWLKHSWNINASLQNVLDANYHNHLDWGDIPRPGRNLRLGLEMRF